MWDRNKLAGTEVNMSNRVFMALNFDYTFSADQRGPWSELQHFKNIYLVETYELSSYVSNFF